MNNSMPLNLYDSCKKSLKETSKDDQSNKPNIHYVSESELEVYDFDDIKEKYYDINNLPKGKKPSDKVMVSSCDALYIQRGSDIKYLIEFKNQKLRDVKKRKIRENISESLLILTDIFEIGISDTREKLTFILVFKDSKELIENVERSRGESDKSDFDLKKYKIYFKECIVCESKAFQEEFANEWEKNKGYDEQ